MQAEEFSPSESLRVIQSMIAKTRQGISQKTHYFLVWGWLSFLALTGQFILKHIVHYEKHYLVWLIVLVGIAYSIITGIRERRNEKYQTYIGESMRNLWSGMGIAYFVLCIVLTKIGWHTSVYPFFIILYGLGTFVSGNILKFRPLVVGGILAWALAVVAVFLPYDYQMLAGAAAILVSYIIPAYLLQKKNVIASTNNK